MYLTKGLTYILLIYHKDDKVMLSLHWFHDFITFWLSQRMCKHVWGFSMKEVNPYGKYVIVKYVVVWSPILLKTNYFKFCFYQYSSLFWSLKTIKRHCCQFPNCYTFNIWKRSAKRINMKEHMQFKGNKPEH